MGLIDEKKALMKEIQCIKGFFGDARKRSNRLRAEFLWNEDAQPNWNESCDLKEFVEFFEWVNEQAEEVEQQLEKCNRWVSNGRPD